MEVKITKKYQITLSKKELEMLEAILEAFEKICLNQLWVEEKDFCSELRRHIVLS